MQLSEQLQPYKEKTCVLVADRLHGKFYLAENREISCARESTNDRLKIEDSERYEGSSGGGMIFQSQDEKLDDREAKKFYKNLTQTLFEMKQKHEYERLLIVIPQNDKNILTDFLHEQIKPILDIVIGKELTHLPTDQLFNRIDEERMDL